MYERNFKFFFRFGPQGGLAVCEKNDPNAVNKTNIQKKRK